MGLFTVTWAGLIPFGGIWMGAVADAAGAPLAVAIGASVCAVVATLVVVRQTRRRELQPAIDPPR
jgi:membrane protein implicated in regulation of membrane protease activity